LSGGNQQGGSREERLDLVRKLGDAMKDVCNDPDMRQEDGSPFTPQILDKYCRERTSPTELLTDQANTYAQFADLRMQILHAQRALVLELRDQGRYSTGALDDALAILDSDEIALSIRESAFERTPE
jgi:CPA1 family monovalent cation:H+ antiporter